MNQFVGDALLEKNLARRQKRRALLLILGAILALAAAGVAFIARYDISRPYDGDLIPDRRSSTTESTPYKEFLDRIDANGNTYLRQKLHLKPAKYEMKEYLLHFNPDFHAVQTLLESDDQPWQFSGADSPPYLQIYWSRLLDFYSGSPSVFGLHFDRIDCSIEEGNSAAAIADVLTVLRLSRGIEAALAPKSTHLDMLRVAGEATQRLEKAVIVFHAISTEQLRHLSNQLLSLQPDRKDVQFSLRSEYEKYLPLQISLQKRVRSLVWPYSDRIAISPSLQFKPNMTSAAVIDRVRPLVASLQKGWPETATALHKSWHITSDKSPPHLSSRFSPNAYGMEEVPRFMRGQELFLSELIDHVTLMRMAALQLALRHYESVHRHLPERLDQLIPATLSTIPEDPVTGKPMVWDQKGQCIQVTWTDLHGNRRPTAPPSTLMPVSQSIPYWWAKDPVSK